MFSYGGAESRKLSVNFNITLLHVMEEEKDLAEMFRSQFKLFFSESERAKDAFNVSEGEVVEEVIAPQWEAEQEELMGSIMGGGGDPFELAEEDVTYWSTGLVTRDLEKESHTKTGVQRDHASIHRQYYRQLIKNVADFDPDSTPEGSNTTTEIPEMSPPDENVTSLNTTLNLVYLWVNLIRASILNNSRSTTLGPPIVRLTHGGMYNNVPCLLQDYSINIVDEAGYDVQTMTPKRLEISLNLIESRTGNFGKFDAGQIELGDNLAGWESIIETNNIDPYNGLIGGEGEFGVEV